MPAGWQDDPAKLNEFAWWCFDHRVGLAEAEELARHGARLAKPGRLESDAEICNLRGDGKDAADPAARAAQEDPGNSYYAKQVDRFQKLLAAKQ